MNSDMGGSEWKMAEVVGSFRVYTRQEINRSWSYTIVARPGSPPGAAVKGGFALEKDAREAAHDDIAQGLLSTEI